METNDCGAFSEDILTIVVFFQELVLTGHRCPGDCVCVFMLYNTFLSQSVDTIK